MIRVVTGGSGSGKSEYAESLLNNISDKKYYVATMIAYGKEGIDRVNRHKALRAGKHFTTIERQHEIALITEDIDDYANAILIECVSNLVANEMFDGEGTIDSNAIIEKVVDGIVALENVTDEIVIVTNNVSEDGIEYPVTTSEYIEVLNQVNAKLFDKADVVTEVVAGIPIILKGNDNMSLVDEQTTNVVTDSSNREIRLYIGGTGSGKYNYVINHNKDKEYVIINKLNLIIKDAMKTGANPYDKVKSMLENSDNIIVICDEIGNGIVPNDAFEREYREIVGRIVTDIAKQAAAVERIVCGLGQRIK